MKKIVKYVFIVFIILENFVFANDVMHAQLTVWNMTKKEIDLHCDLLQQNATLKPTSPIRISANDSPALQLTFQQYGKLVRCAIANTPAWFVYRVKNAKKEIMHISALPDDQANFHYNPVYPGALIYR